MDYDFFDDEGYYNKSRIKKYFLTFFILVYLFPALISIKNGNFIAIILVTIIVLPCVPCLLYFYYQREIYAKVGLSKPVFYSSTALWFLSFAPCTIDIVILHYSFVKGLVLAILVLISLLGVGLRFKSFNDESRGDDFSDIGYNPLLYLIAALFISFLTYKAVFYQPLIFILTIVCYLWIFFPDILNNILPFDNRTLVGFIIYIGLILVVFVICMKSALPDGFFTGII